jgi:hypothetical protein
MTGIEDYLAGGKTGFRLKVQDSGGEYILLQGLKDSTPPVSAV